MDAVELPIGSWAYSLACLTAMMSNAEEDDNAAGKLLTLLLFASLAPVTGKPANVPDVLWVPIDRFWQAEEANPKERGHAIQLYKDYQAVWEPWHKAQEAH